MLLPWVSQTFQRIQQTTFEFSTPFVFKVSQKHSPFCLLSSRQSGWQGDIWLVLRSHILDSEHCQNDVLGCQTYDRKNVIKPKKEINWTQTLLHSPLKHEGTFYPSHLYKHKNTDSHGCGEMKRTAHKASHVVTVRAVSVGRASLHLGLQPSPWPALFKFHISASWARQLHTSSELWIILAASLELKMYQVYRQNATL